MTIPYDPATPLRADATNKQIALRISHLRRTKDWIEFHDSLVARELQAATVAEYQARVASAMADMVRHWRDLDRRIEAGEITTAKAAELFVAEFTSPLPESASPEGI